MAEEKKITDTGRKHGCLYYWCGYDERLGGRKVAANVFRVFNDDDILPRSNVDTLPLKTEFVLDLIFGIFPPDQYEIIFDILAFNVKTHTVMNELAHILQKQQGPFFMGKKHISIQVTGRHVLADFFAAFNWYWEDSGHGLRVIAPRGGLEIDIDHYLTSVPGKYWLDYVKALDTYHAYVYWVAADLWSGFIHWRLSWSTARQSCTRWPASTDSD